VNGYEAVVYRRLAVVEHPLSLLFFRVTGISHEMSGIVYFRLPKKHRFVLWKKGQEWNLYPIEWENKDNLNQFNFEWRSGC